MFKNRINVSAAELPCELATALEGWREEAAQILNEDKVTWYSKLVHTDFEYGGVDYKVEIGDVFSDEVLEKYGRVFANNRLEAVLEVVQSRIKRDLDALGAEHIVTHGMID